MTLTAPAILHAKVDIASSGDNTIVAAQGASNKIRVINYLLQPVGVVNVKWKDDTPTDLSGTMNLSAGGGMAVHGDAWAPLISTAANKALVLNLSAAVQVSGHVSYIVST